jgi:hypothetical protein
MSGANPDGTGGVCKLQFYGDELKQILRFQDKPVEVYDSGGFLRGEISGALAARMMLDAYVGIGNRRRIRYLRPLSTACELSDLRNGSRTTKRVRGNSGQFLGGHTLREHRAIQANAGAHSKSRRA